MPRPVKCRRICALPPCTSFVCADSEGGVPLSMTLEEYEAIRLIDYLGLTQEECAAQMAVARTTVQRIYETARKKMAQFLVTGGSLQIEGGSYTVCKQEDCHCAGCHCPSRRCGRSDCSRFNKQSEKNLP